jgi:hypothetical protein
MQALHLDYQTHCSGLSREFRARSAEIWVVFGIAEGAKK